MGNGRTAGGLGRDYDPWIDGSASDRDCSATPHRFRPALAVGATVPASFVPPHLAESGALTPSQFAALYRQLPVTYRNPVSGSVQQATADVYVYVNQGIERRRANLVEKDRLVALVDDLVRRRRRGIATEIEASHGDRAMIARTFFGKGMPHEVALTLSYALSLDRTRDLADYCTRTARIGLDCSGFVNAYFRYTRGMTAQDIPAYRTNAPRTALEGANGIKALDVLVWEQSEEGAARHIALVDSHDEGSEELVVVESSGSRHPLCPAVQPASGAPLEGGLAVSTYTVADIDARSGVVRVARGDRAGNAVSRVKIFEVPGRV